MDKPSGTAPDWIRDKVFYCESGDCVALVVTTLFKIHRCQLETDGSAFGEMFSLPNGATCPNSTTEDDPLILQDSLDEFRALCWALYALPFEISSQNRADAFIPKFNCFLNLFSISHKYHFESLETWAKELLVHHCIPNGDGKHSILDSPHICNEDIELMLRLAIRTNLDALSRAAENALVNRLKDHFDSDSLIRSLALAEELGMRKFQSRLYYNELMRRESLQTGIQLLTASTQTNNFTEKQSHALFRGYWSLTRYWKDLPSIVRNRPLPSLTSCEDHGRCQNEWNIKWAVDKFNQHIDPSPLDFGPLQKLEKIRSFNNLSSTMRPCGKNQLDCIIEQLQDALADHFLGPRP